MFVVLLTKKTKEVEFQFYHFKHCLQVSTNLSKKKVASVTGVIYYRPKPLFLGSWGNLSLLSVRCIPLPSSKGLPYASRNVTRAFRAWTFHQGTSELPVYIPKCKES
jgi:hypothetical protein